MTRISITLAALILAGTAAAETPEVEAGIDRLARHGGRFDAAIRAIRAEAAKPDWTGVTPAAPLPAHVAAEIARLRQHGDRFEAAIRQIKATAVLPSWGRDETCGHEATNEMLAAF